MKSAKASIPLFLIVAVASAVALLTQGMLAPHLTLARGGRPTQAAAPREEAGRRVTIRAAGRGTPWLNLRDGVELPAGPAGVDSSSQGTRPLSLLPGSAQARSLAAGDFHEDGSTDLIAGYAGSNGGFVVLHRGTAEVQHWPFRSGHGRLVQADPDKATSFSSGPVFSVPEAPDFLGAGDFNADGHMDVVMAARGGRALYLLAGDGHGGFAAPQRLELPGGITALETGEINRADGLADIVVAVRGANRSQVMVFESPLGAWHASAEVFPLPAEVSALTLARLQGNYTVDLAVAAGSHLLVIEGRDRKLSLDESRQKQVPPARITRMTFPFTISSLAAGQFTSEPQTQLALLSDTGELHLVSKDSAASAAPGVSAARRKLQTTFLAPSGGNRATKLLRARLSASQVDDLVLLDSPQRQIHVWMGGKAGGTMASLDVQGEPAAALFMNSNGSALGSLVVQHSASSVPTVLTAATLMTFSVTNKLDAGPNSLRAAIIASNSAGPGPNAINFAILGTAPFVINLVTPLPAVTVTVIIDAATQTGFVGTPLVVLDGSATGANANGFEFGAPNGGLKGFIVEDFTGAGVLVDAAASNTRINTNVFGLAADGVTPAPNGFGIVLMSPSNNVSHTIISGNTNDGIFVTGASATGNALLGNLVGVGINGKGVGNGRDGIAVEKGASLTTMSGNVSSGNKRSGISITDPLALLALLVGNFVGTDDLGVIAIPNLTGISVNNSPNNTIGGTSLFARNVISGSIQDGVRIQGTGAVNNQVQGNFFGTDATGTKALPNGGDGVAVQNGASNNTVGGAATGAGNVSSGNLGGGIFVGGIGTTNNVVQNNKIGTDATGTVALGNGQNGAAVQNGASNNTIGPGNAIANNTQDGVFVDVPSFGVTITQNAIYNNVILPIELQNYVANPCGSTTGANKNQNPPNITSATSDANSTTVQGTLNSTPNAAFITELYNGLLGRSAGQNFLGATTVTTGPNCLGTFNVSFPVGGLAGQFITATATDPVANTSQLATPIAILVTGTCLPITVTSSPLPGTVGAPFAASIVAMGGISPHTFNASSLPLGLSLFNPTQSTIELRGTPTLAGTFTFTVTATDSTPTPPGPCSGSGTFTITINPANTTTTVASSANPSVFGQGVIFRATVAETGGGTVTPTGLVQVMFNGIPISPPLLLLSGTVGSPFISTLPTGTDNIQVNYLGDGNNNPSFGTLTQTVNKAGVTLKGSCPQQVIAFISAPCQFIGIVNSPSLALVSGAVQPIVDGNAGASVPMTNGLATVPITFVTIGPHTVGGTFLATPNFNPATAPTFTVTVTNALTVNLVPTGTLTFDPANKVWIADMALTDTGTDGADNTILKTLTVNGFKPATPLPITFGNIAAGATSNHVRASFPSTAATSGTTAVVRFSGTYTGHLSTKSGTFAVSLRVQAP